MILLRSTLKLRKMQVRLGVWLVFDFVCTVYKDWDIEAGNEL